DVADLAGKTAKVQVVDRATGGWGHINVDQIVLSDKKASGVLGTASRELVARGRYLHIPVRRGAPKRTVTVSAGGREEQTFSVELAEGAPEWWAYLDISAWRGRPLVVRVSRVPEDSNLLASLEQGDSIRGTEDLYREPLRPQLHFSPLRGWTNDPNGLVYLNGEYHLYFQHNPYGWDWGNMHWGHAVSRDLVHWDERGEALYPDSFGPMFSGSAVVDWKNTSGLGRGGAAPLLLFYTAAGNPTVQCLASSTDGGKTVVKYDGNPIVGQYTPGNRDPKVLWHEPTGRWVMTLYVERGGKHTIQFLSSTDAIHWKDESAIDGFFECPDLFPLRVDGDPARTLWVLTAADSGYML
ncbi:glycoside hydrolase family 32 protein, partial [Singulisphaera rosea]